MNKKQLDSISKGELEFKQLTDKERKLPLKY